MLRRLTLPTLLILALAVPATASARLDIGISDQRPRTFTNKYFKKIHSIAARYILPYDVMKDGYQFHKWVAWESKAREAGQKILVSFEHSRRSRKLSKSLPTPAKYRSEITAFAKLYAGDIEAVSPWNEVNRKYEADRGEGQPTWKNPTMVAKYYGVASQVFAGKKIVAIDLLDQKDVRPSLRYLAKFKSAVRKLHLPKVKIWGLHPYSDINRFSTKRTKKLLKATGKGDVWLTEASGMVKFGHSWPYDPKRAARANKCMFTIAHLSKRIKRLYFFAWFAGGTFDAGVVNAKGNKTRPGYKVLLKRQRGRCGH